MNIREHARSLSQRRTDGLRDPLEHQCDVWDQIPKTAQEVDEVMHRLLTALQSAGESSIQTFLTEHEWLFAELLIGSHGEIVFPKFRLGNEFACDFLVLQWHSGWWIAHLIELEPPDEPMLTKDGALSGRAKGALKQCGDWEQWISENSSFFKNEIIRALERKGIGQPGSYGPQGSPRIERQYWVLIGRQSGVEGKQKTRAGQSAQLNVEIVTYDRLAVLLRHLRGKLER